MIEAEGNLWEIFKDNKTLRVIPTNGWYKTNGELVMGRGVALQAKQRWKWLPKILGEKVKDEGNIVHIVEDFSVASFPVKHSIVNENASLSLIERSAIRLYDLTINGPWDYVVLPMVGCGNGH